MTRPVRFVLGIALILLVSLPATLVRGNLGGLVLQPGGPSFLEPEAVAFLRRAGWCPVGGRGGIRGEWGAPSPLGGRRGRGPGRGLVGHRADPSPRSALGQGIRGLLGPARTGWSAAPLHESLVPGWTEGGKAMGPRTALRAPSPDSSGTGAENPL
jgi:hypothetical protein